MIYIAQKHGKKILPWTVYIGNDFRVYELVFIQCGMKFVSNDNHNKMSTFDKISKYLTRFAIANIEINLIFPLIWDKQIAFVGYLCYFVIGNKTKFMDILKKFNSIKIDQECVEKQMKRIWFNPAVLEKRIFKLNDKIERMKVLISCMQDLRSYATKYWAQNHSKIVVSVLDERTRNAKDFLIWKNVIFNKLKRCNFCDKTCNESSLLVCKRCRQARYCSKICQKSDWNIGSHKDSCK